MESVSFFSPLIFFFPPCFVLFFRYICVLPIRPSLSFCPLPCVPLRLLAFHFIFFFLLEQHILSPIYLLFIIFSFFFLLSLFDPPEEIPCSRALQLGAGLQHQVPFILPGYVLPSTYLLIPLTYLSLLLSLSPYFFYSCFVPFFSGVCWFKALKLARITEGHVVPPSCLDSFVCERGRRGREGERGEVKLMDWKKSDKGRKKESIGGI